MALKFLIAASPMLTNRWSNKPDLIRMLVFNSTLECWPKDTASMQHTPPLCSLKKHRVTDAQFQHKKSSWEKTQLTLTPLTRNTKRNAAKLETKQGRHYNSLKWTQQLLIWEHEFKNWINCLNSSRKRWAQDSSGVHTTKLLLWRNQGELEVEMLEKKLICQAENMLESLNQKLGQRENIWDGRQDLGSNSVIRHKLKKP